jgi:hypothetical protein
MELTEFDGLGEARRVLGTRLFTTLTWHGPLTPDDFDGSPN